MIIVDLLFQKVTENVLYVSYVSKNTLNMCLNSFTKSMILLFT